LRVVSDNSAGNISAAAMRQAVVAGVPPAKQREDHLAHCGAQKQPTESRY